MRIVDKFCVGEFHFAGRCDEEKCHIGRSVVQTLTRITEILSRYIDDRYRFRLVPVGSAADGSKLFLPDEFDFLLVVLHRQLFDDLCQSEQKVMLKLALSEAIKILASVEPPVDQRLKFQFTECVKISTKICYKIAFTWQGKKYPHLNITCDLTPVYRSPWNEHGGRLSDQDLGRWSQIPDCHKEFFITAEVGLPLTIPTIECRILTSNGPILQKTYCFLKLLVQSFYVHSRWLKSTYNVKMALLNYSKDNKLPSKVEAIPDYCVRILELVLFRQERITKFGFVPWWNAIVSNCCYSANKQRKFPRYGRLLLGSKAYRKKSVKR